MDKNIMKSVEINNLDDKQLEMSKYEVQQEVAKAWNKVIDRVFTYYGGEDIDVERLDIVRRTDPPEEDLYLDGNKLGTVKNVIEGNTFKVKFEKNEELWNQNK